MNLDFTAAEVAFRDEARAWLRANLPSGPRPSDGADMRAFDLGWQQTLHAGGWAGINWPTEFGGRGLSDIEQMIWYEEFARADPPFTLNNSCTFVGNNHGGPTLIACGSEEQKRQHLPPILRGEVVWCQGFSEPGAGSDLASLSARAVVDGDELVVNGQKIWTSYAQVADFQELLVRTDPTAPKHKGISWVICDMTTPGIDIRPITTMAHTDDFCEVFYDDVRIPLANVVGELNDGWRVAMSTLSFERGTAFMADQVDLANVVERLISEARERTGPDGRRRAIDDDEIARRLATVRAEVAALRAMTVTGISRIMRSGIPGPEGSMIRLFHGELHQRVYQLSLDIIGADALELTPIDGDGWSGPYLQSFAYTIGGGTSDIQRNIVGERMLGLPRVKVS